MIRRLFTLVFMGLAFYWGLQAERYMSKDRCLDAGGGWNKELRVCAGLEWVAPK